MGGTVGGVDFMGNIGGMSSMKQTAMETTFKQMKMQIDGLKRERKKDKEKRKLKKLREKEEKSPTLTHNAMQCVSIFLQNMTPWLSKYGQLYVNILFILWLLMMERSPLHRIKLNSF